MTATTDRSTHHPVVLDHAQELTLEDARKLAAALLELVSTAETVEERA